MTGISRTGVSLDGELLGEFDRLIARRGYGNRSEALRDLIRDALVAEAADENQRMVGALTLIYDHSVPNLTQKMTEAQHHAAGMVIATTHVHLDHDLCLEVILLEGRSGDIRAMSDRLLSLRGVKHGKLVLTGTASDPRAGGAPHPQAHPHHH